MQKLFLTIGAVLILLLSSFAQEPVPAPADVVLGFEIEGGRHQFHLGELIPVNYSYRTETSGRYVKVSQTWKLTGGHSLEVSCSPSVERVSAPMSPSDVVSFEPFKQMLAAEPCSGPGVGGGVGCGGCDQELPLTPPALTFGVVPLNAYVRFRMSGTYTCEASSAEITTSSRDDKFRPALLVTSKPIALTLVNNPAWAHSAAISYADAYDKLCRGNDVVEHRFLQCSDLARRITYLDTVDSLAIEVKGFDGRSHGWDNGFWDAIRHSSNPQEALRLMTSRMQESDFQVSTDVLEWLASSELRAEVPEAFQSGTPAIYHAQAVEKLRKYVRLLGSSLSKKAPEVFLESAKTYRTFAERSDCEQQLLISTEEQNQIFAGIGIQP